MKSLIVSIPKNIFAVFAVAKVGDKFCATTRLDGSIGLPGGKVEENDNNIFETCIRESREEGWDLDTTGEILQLTTVHGKLVAWLKCYRTSKLRDYKEKNRGISPILASAEELNNPGMKNDFLSFL